MEDFNKFNKKLLIEAILKSVILGFTCGFILMTLINLVLFCCGINQWLIVLLIGVAVSIALTIVAYFMKFRPSVKYIAKRVDEVGLDERAITMVEFQDDETLIAQMQKQDAKESISRVPREMVKICISKLSIIILSICFLIFMPTAIILPANAQQSGDIITDTNGPNDVITTEPVKTPEEEVEDIIEKLLEELHKIVDEAVVKQEVKDILNDILDNLETRLEEEDLTLEEKIAIIEETREEILRIIEENTEFARLLAEYLKLDPLTEELGEDIEEKDVEGIEPTLEDIKEQINSSEDKQQALENLETILNESLEYAEGETNESLMEAMQQFADDITDLKEQEELDTASMDLVFETAAENIANALQSSEELIEVGNDVATEIQEAVEELKDVQSSSDGGEEEDSSSDERPSDSGSEGEPAESDTPPTPPDDDNPLDSEPIIDGETPYLDVIDQYYADMVEYLNTAELDDSVRQVIETYLEIIK